ncbi:MULTISPECIES: GNAT family N-acetyltransferase [Tenacibaculum]|uniref:GNAT family N-acetyltransferase n=1 Tax=Tenacibaculum TaxID=104267 RepID=UPI001F0A8895|nr:MULTISPECIES: GNAT family N-acetyltransferase [Tenacibaculum]MCH3883141.1 GNAT family N-acetyltransferase [Tenacibaculum aquimarinum]MDO6600879.1 GNAT family N-acetyltransferase [Tenacibaculum sp. 1_MG-2023]
MNNVIINPKGYEEDYLKYLNQCFNNWGDIKDYQWVFNRTIGDKKSDIIIIKDEEGEVIAGSGVTYRQIKNENGDVFYIGTMTGSWTLPKARGKGCFTQIINLSKDLCKKNNVPFLTAYVMETNPSYRRLKSEGSALINSFTLFSPEVSYTTTQVKTELVVNVNKEVLEEIFILKQKTANKSHYNYSFEEFYNQYYIKNKTVEVLKLNNNFAIIEEAYNVIKVNYLTSCAEDVGYNDNIKSLTNWTLKERGKKLMMFTTEELTKEKLLELNFEFLPGYFTVLNSNELKVAPVFNKLSIEMGDKM